MARTLIPDWRVGECMRRPVGGLVSVHYQPEHGSATFGGLKVCGSVWVCPVCAARIGARRAQDVAAAAPNWIAKGGRVLMLTLTLQHHAGRQLGELNQAMNAAYRQMRQGKSWVSFVQRYKLAGSITAREYTHGGNGWHPHLHVLFFLESAPGDGELAAMEQFLAKRWRSALAKRGETADLEHGTDLRPADKSAGDYVAKLSATWSVGAELAGASSKEGRRGSSTPAQLLDRAMHRDEAAGALFVEYAHATYGKNWITWSRGLRELCGLDQEEASDQELAEEHEAGGLVLLVLTHEQWYWVVGNALRGELLYQAHAGDGAYLAAWLALQGLEVEPWQINYGMATAA